MRAVAVQWDHRKGVPGALRCAWHLGGIEVWDHQPHLSSTRTWWPHQKVIIKDPQELSTAHSAGRSHPPSPNGHSLHLRRSLQGTPGKGGHALTFWDFLRSHAPSSSCCPSFYVPTSRALDLTALPRSAHLSPVVLSCELIGDHKLGPAAAFKQSSLSPPLPFPHSHSSREAFPRNRVLQNTTGEMVL